MLSRNSLGSTIPTELQDFFKSLEDLNSISVWEIFKKLANSQDIDGEWESKLIAERKVLLYSLNKGELKSSAMSFDVRGKEVPLEMTAEETDYLKERIKTTGNIFLLSKYSHLLWQITKHNSYADIALANYLQVIHQMAPDDQHQMPNVLDVILLISQKTKKRREEVLDLLEFLFSEKSNGLRSRFLQSILDFNFLKQDELSTIGKAIPGWIELDEITSYFTNEKILQLGLVLYHKTSLDKTPLYLLLAKNEDTIIEANSEDSSFVKLEYVSKKADYFLKAGDAEEAEKCFQEINRLKATVDMGGVSIELRSKVLGLFNEIINSMSTQLLNHNPSEILGFFAEDQAILVDRKSLIEEAEKHLKNSITNLCTVTSFDNNNNFHNLNDEDKLQREIVTSYTIRNLHLELLFSKVLVNGILQGKIRYYSVYEFLEKETWFGTKFHRKLGATPDDLESNWISFLAPGLHSLFGQFEMGTLLRDNKINNFILAMDSLTLKFEGALRDFIRLTGGSTTKFKEGKQQEEVLEELLNNKRTKELFSERDIDLFKYTFTSHGKNLRNNIAHSFLNFSQYHFQPAALIFLCILRLGKYSLTRKEEEGPQNLISEKDL